MVSGAFFRVVFLDRCSSPRGFFQLRLNGKALDETRVVELLEEELEGICLGPSRGQEGRRVRIGIRIGDGFGGFIDCIDGVSCGKRVFDELQILGDKNLNESPGRRGRGQSGILQSLAGNREEGEQKEAWERKKVFERTGELLKPG